MPDVDDSPEKQGSGGRDSRGRWLSGVSGNPGGRSPGVYLASAVRHRLENVYDADDPAAMSALESILDNVVRIAKGHKGGAKEAAHMLLDRGYGKVPDKLIAGIAHGPLARAPEDMLDEIIGRGVVEEGDADD